MIKIVVDSTCDLNEAYLIKHGITMVPLQILIDGMAYRDKETITVDELYNLLKIGKTSKTSQPNPLDVYQRIENLLKDGHDVIFICFSSKMSGTFQSIKLILDDLQEKYTDNKITLIDSKGGAGIPALMAMHAVKLIAQGCRFDSIIYELKQLVESAEHIFSIDDLSYLFRGGRLKRSEAIFGNLLRVKPILHVVDGEIQILQKVRGSNKALQTIASLVAVRMKEYPNQTVAIMHADDLGKAVDMKSMISNHFPQANFLIEKIGSTLGSHLGIGGVGVFFFRKPPSLT
jgi:DegV family protein with EDD domain